MGLSSSDYRVVAEVRRRERDRGRLLPGDADLYAADQSPVAGWGPMHGFYEFFLDGDPSSVALPIQVVSDGCFEMFEAAREVGMRTLVDFARQAAPVAAALIALSERQDRKVDRA